jgi:hypothetical protein
MLRSLDESVFDEDNLTATVTYRDGSVMTLLYSTAGPKDHPKERFELFGPGFSAELIEYRELHFKGKDAGRHVLRTADKGQREEMQAWGRYLTGGDAGTVADFAAAATSTVVTLLAREAARTGSELPAEDLIRRLLGT